jgi:hypothetical protein
MISKSIQRVAGDALIGFPILVPRPGDHVGGQRGRGRLLVPTDALEVVADELLIERRLRLAGRVEVRGPEPRRIGSKGLVDPNQFVADEAEFEFCVGDDDAAGGSVFGGAPIDFKAVSRSFSARGRPTRATVSSKEMFSS